MAGAGRICNRTRSRFRRLINLVTFVPNEWGGEYWAGGGGGVKGWRGAARWRLGAIKSRADPELQIN